MFGGLVPTQEEAETTADAPGPSAFQVLVNAIVEQQAAGLVRKDDPLQLAQFIWALVHGVAMLVLDGALPAAGADALVTFANERLRAGIAA